jgi:hypothetical protein
MLSGVADGDEEAARERFVRETPERNNSLPRLFPADPGARNIPRQSIGGDHFFVPPSTGIFEVDR